MRRVLAAAALLGIAACLPHAIDPGIAPAVEVRYRWGDPPSEAGRRLLAALPGSRWDPGLLAAARELAASASAPDARLSPRAAAAATARAGFPGDARFVALRTGGAFPDTLVRDARAAHPPDTALDVGLASRASGDGTVLWILAFAAHRGEIDPMPRDLGLDAVLPVRVEVPGDPRLALVVAPPDGRVRSLPIAGRVTRQVDAFHTPGAYRFEVVEVDRARVAFVFEVFVEVAPPPPPALPGPPDPPDPVAAVEALYRALDGWRIAAGLPPLARFPPFEALAREHAALMASSGVVDHVIPRVTEGVAARARAGFHPGAEHHEDLAAAYSAEEALDLVWLSPGHRLGLLCATCTHVAIGTALEPVRAGTPRLFVTWELLAFPHGPPKAVARPR